MTARNEDIALDVFLSVAKDRAPILPKDLLIEIYNSQKRHQYDQKDRSSSMNELERLVEGYLDNSLKGSS
jgi:hypothetical protein